MAPRAPQRTLPDRSRRSKERFDFHFFAYFQGWEEDRTLKAHHLRDGVAFSVLSATLIERGGRYAGRFRNGPATRERVEHYKALMRQRVDANQPCLIEDLVEYRPVDESFLRRHGLLVVPTRLPMNDFSQEERVQVQPGFTSLEEKIIRAARPYLPVCARSRVRIADGLASLLAPEFADRSDILFQSYAEPWYKALRTADPTVKEREPDGERRRTMVYLLQLPSVPELAGADLLVMWGQGGTQTLAVAELLQTDLSHLLDCYGLSMIELSAPASIQPRGPLEKPYELLDSLGDWGNEVVLEGGLLDANGKPMPQQPAAATRRTMKRVGAESIAKPAQARD